MVGSLCVAGESTGARADMTAQGCLDGTAPAGSVYRLTTAPAVHKKDPPTVLYGTFTGYFALASPSCPGVAYEIHVLSYDGTSLDYVGFSATPPAATGSISTDGTEATVSFPGDLKTVSFTARVTTGPDYLAPCVVTYATIEVGGHVVERGPAVGTWTDCDNGTAGENPYFG